MSTVLIKAGVVSSFFLSFLTSLDTYLKDSATHSESVPTPLISYTSFTDHDNMNSGEKQKYQDLPRTLGPQSTFPYSKPQETRTQKRHAHVSPTNLITQHPDQPVLPPSHIQPESLSAHDQTFKQISLQGLSDKHTISQQDHSSSSSVVQPLELTQASGFTLYNMNSTSSTTSAEVHQYWSQSTEQLTATKASQANNTELVEMLNKNTSKAPMRTTDNNAR